MDPEHDLPPSTLLTTISIYYHTHTFTSSCLPYHENSSMVFLDILMLIVLSIYCNVLDLVRCFTCTDNRCHSWGIGIFQRYLRLAREMGVKVAQAQTSVSQNPRQRRSFSYVGPVSGSIRRASVVFTFYFQFSCVG